jgi:prephenate dehydrogenase
MTGALPIRKLVVIGTGLIGGSFSLALKQAGLARMVVGIGRRQETLEEAIRLGIIDVAGSYDQASFANADLILVATPVGQMRAVFKAMAEFVPIDAVITDGGSTKLDVIKLAREFFSDSLDRFVPAHPISGTEKNGPSAAFPDLYRSRRVIITPMTETAPSALELVRNVWQACGAIVSELAADRHDALLGAVSHLPHLLAFALVEELASRPDGQALFSFAGGGFRDFTRIASSNPEMWRDIFLSNREAVSNELVAYRNALAVLQEMLDAGDGDSMQALFERARDARQGWLRKD